LPERREEESMYALIGRVQIKRGHEEETAEMAREHGPELVRGMPGSTSAFWARAGDGRDELIQHSFWVFETEEDARAAETLFNSLRDMPSAPAVLISTDVCEVIAQL
jgi:hypothetical protein